MFLSEKIPCIMQKILFRGRHGFDVGHETGGACRGADYLVNTTANILVANEDNYALAA
jgi:hypothetical protein